ncbi:YojF family protein [Paenibacillus sp. N1-5-1-14]|uniref:YojF family protein n=1 Tax=Paenibacillus radicibacter TaxID=2972488 RepID=UPI0021599EB0|nr:YojF family protein [Paenibacillus radicibacter]MCR8643551.1 YojF family protein [Paenibacillus radicibacter]
MKPIHKQAVTTALRAFIGQQVYIHAEAIPGGFLRNISVEVEQAMIAGEGPYRVAIRIPYNGWIRMESLTHYISESEEKLLLAGHDEQGRITTVLELSTRPFHFNKGGSVYDGS